MRTIDAGLHSRGVVAFLLLTACAPTPRSVPAAPFARRVMAPPLNMFAAVVTSDSATFAIPIPGARERSWHVVSTSNKPGPEYSVTVQWDTGTVSVMHGGYIDGIGLHLNGAGKPAPGSLTGMIAASELMAVARLNETGLRSGLVAGAEPALRAYADSSRLFLVLGASDRLSRLRRTRPDSAYVTVILVPIGVSFDRMIPIRFH